jgi:hypothetical protein
MMDFLSIAGFALNVVSYLKENPIEIELEPPTAVVDTMVSEKPAIAEELQPKKLKGLSDIVLPTAPVVLAKTKPQHHYLKGGSPKKITTYRKKTSVGEGGEISMVRTRSGNLDSGMGQTDLLPRKVEAKSKSPKVESGLNQSGQYFFRKRAL